MADGSTPVAQAGSLAQVLDQLEQAVERDERDYARILIAEAKTLVADSGESEVLESLVASTLLGSFSYDSMHNATCMLEYLRQIESGGSNDESDDLTDNQRFGRWLIQATITNLLRYGLQQQRDEERRTPQ